jgi:hypothetical protein
MEIGCLERWRDKAMHGLEEGLWEREGDPVQVALDEAKPAHLRALHPPPFDRFEIPVAPWIQR